MSMPAKSIQLCPTLWDPMDCSPPGSSVHGILQARILEWVAIPSSRGSSRLKDWTWVCCIAGGFFTTASLGNVPFTQPLISEAKNCLTPRFLIKDQSNFKDKPHKQCNSPLLILAVKVHAPQVVPGQLDGFCFTEFYYTFSIQYTFRESECTREGVICIVSSWQSMQEK